MKLRRTRSDDSRFRRQQRARPDLCGGFTIIEVSLAATILLLGITTSITTLQRGLQALDTSRHLNLAAQVMQSEFERLRIKNWEQLQNMQSAGEAEVPVSHVAGIDNGSLVCRRTIRDLREGMKEISLLCTWRGYDGREHNVRYITRYGKSGLYDYFYTAH